jgi:hypothetical protein
MAVITNIATALTAFKVNDTNAKLVDNTGTYGTQDVLNGGELVENTLSYSFSVNGLRDHRIGSITISAILLNADGSLATARNIKTQIKDYGNAVTQNFAVSDAQKVIIPITISNNVLVENNVFAFEVLISTPGQQSVYYAMTGVTIDLDDVPESVVLSFSGPASNRGVSSITVAPLIKVQGTEAVTFSKDATVAFDSNVDSVEGRVYFRKDGIYVDNYKYGAVNPATANQLGLVKLFNTFASDENGIIAPNGDDLAATPQLVYNAVASLKNYADELVNGITAPNIFIEAEVSKVNPDTGKTETTVEDVPLLEAVRFSDDFEATDENRIYIKWLEIA